MTYIFILPLEGGTLLITEPRVGIAICEKIILATEGRESIMIITMYRKSSNKRTARISTIPLNITYKGVI